MKDVEETLARLSQELNALRVAQAKFVRETADLLANLDAENMPSIDTRLSALEAAVATLVAAE
ncbi:MAG: hypothetical protein IJ012_05275 [Clostridia bacterium]|nr:hypothetical protein [Clostridia bacterium]